MDKTILCARCKRKLHGRASRYAGIGPTCAKKNPALAAQLRLEAEGQVNMNFVEGDFFPSVEIGTPIQETWGVNTCATCNVRLYADTAFSHRLAPDGHTVMEAIK